MALAQMELTGSQELANTLLKLPDKMVNRVLGASMRKGARPIVKAAKAHARVNSGLLVEAQTQRQKTSKAKGVIVIIGAKREVKEVWRKDDRQGRSARQVEADASRYAHLEEFGTYREAAHPFMRPAYDEQVGAALTIIERSAQDLTEKELAKL